MLLLNVHSLQFQEFSGAIPQYIITSHRWLPEGEATYKDVLKRQHTDSRGYKKIEKFCEFVRNTKDEDVGRCEWIWIDTCCIDKRSSAEISESINSMYEWYKKAWVCLAYLVDVCPLSESERVVLNEFKKSDWLTSGWTLQELVAPRCMKFLNREWEVFGTKPRWKPYMDDPLSTTLITSEIVSVTGISWKVLLWHNYDEVSVEERMRWAENRQTTKPEYMAYALLGLFDVHMPLIYGEGRENAQRRLREEIEKKTKKEASPQGIASTSGFWTRVFA